LRVRSHDTEARPTWLELFFDLVFVVVLARLSDLLASNPEPKDFLEYFGLFVAVWFTWVSFTVYSDRFEVDDVLHRLLVLAAMLATIVVAIHVDDAFSGGSAPFALASIGVRALLVAVNLRAVRTLAEARRFEGRYVVGWSIGLALWAASLAVPTPARYVVWGVAVAVEVLTPLVVEWRVGRVPLVGSHIAERFGLFTIIVLGESVVSVGAGIADVNFALTDSLIAIGTFAIAAALWWLYFDCVTTRHADSASFVYAHAFVYGGLGAVAPGALLCILGADDPSLRGGARAALFGGVMLYLGGLAVIEATGRGGVPARRRAAVRVLAAVVALGLAFATASVAPIVAVALLTAVVVAELVYELVALPRARAPTPSVD
jgi:low temperature requirement protein LtrA